MTITFIKDKETKTKVRFTATGDVSGSIYIEKDSELAKDSEIILKFLKLPLDIADNYSIMVV